ncbi:MAG: diacylglycerol kinase family lipid kinase [Lachnospiraceae bacterium]|jgi:diacylglycerol kinase family enzyme|nr:diacylglycerol kinase family lipid kinase [Lachnospiraceae bacterium]
MIYFIVNPVSGCGLGLRKWNKLEKLIQRKGLEYEAYLTSHPGDAREYAATLGSASLDERVVAVVGGDGTMNEVVDGLDMRQPVQMAYLPVGASGELQNCLHLTRSPRAFCRKLLSGVSYRLLDYGIASCGTDEVVHRRFMTGAGLGLDAAVRHSVNHSSFKRLLHFLRLEKWIYFFIGCRQILCAHPVRGYLLLDGVKRVEFQHMYMAMANVLSDARESRFFERYAREEGQTDGRLQVCVISSAFRPKLIPVLFRLYGRSGKKSRNVRRFLCSEVIFHTERPIAVHADGESCLTQSDIQISCVEKKIKMIV